MWTNRIVQNMVQGRPLLKRVMKITWRIKGQKREAVAV